MAELPKDDALGVLGLFYFCSNNHDDAAMKKTRGCNSMLTCQGKERSCSFLCVLCIKRIFFVALLLFITTGLALSSTAQYTYAEPDPASSELLILNLINTVNSLDMK
jgi:hypothetical protein